MKRQLKLLYFSPTGSTEKIVKEVVKGMNLPYQTYDITLPINRKEQLSFDSNDLVVIGVPVYSGRIPEILTDYLMRVKGNHTPAVFIVIYGNRDYDDALLELKNCFENNGFIGIAGGAFIGEHSFTEKVATNRPDLSDLEKANRLGAEIMDLLIKYENTDIRSKLVVKGNFPYKERKASVTMLPETNHLCIHCGICAANCPTGAIDSVDFNRIDEKKCIRCCNCIKKCPVNGKAIHHEGFIKITQMLIDNFSSIRKEPEIFLQNPEE